MKRFLFLMVAVVLVGGALAPLALRAQTPPTGPECRLTRGGFVGTIVGGGLQYKPWGKFTPDTPVVAEIYTRGCVGKTLKLYVRSLSQSGGGIIEATRDGVDVPITEGNESGAIRFQVNEEMCKDLHADDLVVKTNSDNTIKSGGLIKVLFGVDSIPTADLFDTSKPYKNIYYNFLRTARDTLNNPMVFSDHFTADAYTKDIFPQIAARMKRSGVTVPGTITTDEQTEWALNNITYIAEEGAATQAGASVAGFSISGMLSSISPTLGMVSSQAVWFLNLADEQREAVVQATIAKTIFYKAGIIDCMYELVVVDPTSQTEIQPFAPNTNTVIDNIYSYFANTVNLNNGRLQNADPRRFFGFSCAYNGWFGGIGNDCTGTWKITTPFVPGTTAKPDKTSLCYDETTGTYDKNCYELLAPIPGFGRRIIFNEPDPITGKTFTLGVWISTIIKVAIGLASVGAVVYTMWAGAMYAYSGRIHANNPELIKKVKGHIWNGMLAILVLALSYIVLRALNERLLNIDISFDKVQIEATDFLGGDAFYAITGKRILTTEEYQKIARTIALTEKVDYCAVEALLTKESRSRPDAIGRDENISGTRSHKALVQSNKTYNGNKVTKGVNDNDLDMEKNTNTPHLGLDWRFSQGIGLMQVTLFPPDYNDKADYFAWATSDAAFNARKVPHTRLIGSTSYSARQLLDPETNVRAGIQILKEAYTRCGSLYKAFGAYNAYACSSTTPYAQDVSARYGACCKEEGNCTMNR